MDPLSELLFVYIPPTFTREYDRNAFVGEAMAGFRHTNPL